MASKRKSESQTQIADGNPLVTMEPMQTILPEFVGDIVLEYIDRDTNRYCMYAVDVLDLADRRVRAIGKKVIRAFAKRKDASLDPSMVSDCTPNSIEKLKHVLGDIDAMDPRLLRTDIPRSIMMTCQLVLFFNECRNDYEATDTFDLSDISLENLYPLEKAHYVSMREEIVLLRCVDAFWQFIEYPIDETRSVIYAEGNPGWKLLYYRKRDVIRLIGLTVYNNDFEYMFDAKKDEPYGEQLLAKMGSQDWFRDVPEFNYFRENGLDADCE